jgi:hypothetical protein
MAEAMKSQKKEPRAEPTPEELKEILKNLEFFRHLEQVEVLPLEQQGKERSGDVGP